MISVDMSKYLIYPRPFWVKSRHPVLCRSHKSVQSDVLRIWSLSTDIVVKKMVFSTWSTTFLSLIVS